MALEAIKGTGAAYQGSGQKPVTETASVEAESGASGVSRDSGGAGLQSQTVAGGSDITENKRQSVNEALKKAAEEINKRVPDTEAVYGVHEQTNRITIKIVNKDTKEVIKEFPPEQTLDVIAKVWELAGIMVDEKR